MLVPINITGQSYKNRSKPLSKQVTQNFYSELLDDQAVKSNYVLQPFPGMTLFGTGTGVDRGMIEHNSILYKVSGTTLYSVDSNGAHTTLGTIPGTGRCILEGIGSSIVVVSQGIPYLWNGSTLATITDSDLETPNGATHLNNQMIFDGDGGRFVSSLVGDATDIPGLNYATAESNADDLLRAYAFDQLLYLFGNKTLEVWWNSGVGSPPFDRMEGAIMQIGLAAIHSVSHNDEFMYCLSDDNHVYRVKGASKEPVDSAAIHSEVSAFSQTSDAIGFCFTMEGQNFYCLTFPGENVTKLFSETTGWSDLSSGTQGKRSYANSYAYAFRKHLVADYRSGNIYEWDLENYTDNGDAIVRLRDTGSLHGGLFGKPGKRVTMNSFELIMETGVGLVTGQGQDPVILLQFSDDGGQTFSTEMPATIGKLGEFQWQVRWDCLGSFHERIMRVRISDPVFCSIHNASADLEVGI